MRILKLYAVLVVLAISCSALFLCGHAALAMSDQALVSLLNNERQKAGLQPLTSNSSLQRSSQAKGSDMLAGDYWSHNAPNGTEPWHFFDESGYVYDQAGENLAKNFTSPESVIQGWMNSPTHRANILNPAYKEIGISAIDGTLLGEQTTLVVAHFGTRATVIPQAKVATTTTFKAPQWQIVIRTLLTYESRLNGLLPVR